MRPDWLLVFFVVHLVGETFRGECEALRKRGYEANAAFLEAHRVIGLCLLWRIGVVALVWAIGHWLGWWL